MENRVEGRYYSLDALRGIAAVMVVFWHAIQLISPQYRWMKSGHLAVDFFFLLSGFVIAQAYEHRLRGDLSFVSFAAIRAIRLYPMILLGVGIGFVKPAMQLLAQLPHAPSLGNALLSLVTNALVLPTPDSGLPFPRNLLFPLNLPEWSLFMEILVNIAFAAILFKMDRRVLILLYSVLAGLLFCYVIADPKHPPISAGWTWGWHNVGVGLARTALSFSLGMVLFRFGCGRLRRRSAMAPALVILALATILSIGSDGLENLVTIAIVFPILLWAGASFEPPSAWTGASALLGDLSYPLYTIHYPILMLYLAVAKRLDGHELLHYSLYFFLCIAAAYTSLRLYDAPVRRWMSRYLSQRVRQPSVERDYTAGRERR